MSVRESIRYLEMGRGNVPVVLLHGLFGSPENWRVIMEDLADDYRLLALQFPIDHRSNRRHTDFRGIEQLTDYVEAFLDQVGLEEIVLCGNSLGGQVAVDFCLRDPGRVRRLVITGSAGLFERSLSGGRRPRVSRELVRERAADIFHDRKHVTDELVEEVYKMLTDRHYVRFLIRIAKATRNRNMSEELWQVKLPTMTGGHSQRPAGVHRPLRARPADRAAHAIQPPVARVPGKPDFRLSFPWLKKKMPAGTPWIRMRRDHVRRIEVAGAPTHPAIPPRSNARSPVFTWRPSWFCCSCCCRSFGSARSVPWRATPTIRANGCRTVLTRPTSTPGSRTTSAGTRSRS